jgi:hypothetical protein
MTEQNLIDLLQNIALLVIGISLFIGGLGGYLR